MIGQTISHYKILDKLGEGGMGVVYEARDTKLDRLVALKFLPAHVSVNEETKARFLQEAKAVAALNHNNICTIYGVEEHESKMFFAMEYVDGGTLRDRIPFKKLDEAIAASIQIGEALQEAHSKGIVHRDIKADNIMLTSKGQIKVMDFGLAKLKGSLKLTRSSSTVGTLAYMAPEQIQGGEVDARSDIFAFGVLLFEMLTGKLPFRGEHEAAMMYSILNEEPDAIRKHIPDVSASCERILEKALEKNPEERYQSAADMVADLKRWKRGTGTVSRPAMTVPRPAETQQPVSGPSTQAGPKALLGTQNGRRLAGAVGIVTILVAAFLLFWPSGRQSSEKKTLAVLPFENQSDPAKEYFADGLTGEITTRLSSLSGLGVIARSSAREYKGTKKSIKEIGNELGIEFVLMGTVRWSGEQVRVSPELINVNSGLQVWSQTLDASASDAFALQSDIASKVASALNVNLLKPEEASLEQNLTTNAEAYDFYLQGVEYLNRGDLLADYQIAIQLLDRAINADPLFAAAHAKLSYAHSGMYWFFYDRSDERVEKSRQGAEKALSLSPNLPAAHESMGWYYYHARLDYANALREFSTALDLQPSNTEVYYGMAAVYRRQGRMEEAIEAFRRAIAGNPRSADMIRQLGETLILARRHAEAEEAFVRAADLAPDFRDVHAERVQNLLLWKGNVEEVWEVIRDGLQHGRDAQRGKYLDGVDYVASLMSGNLDRAETAVKRTGEDGWSNQFVNYPPSLLLAHIEALRGSRESSRSLYEKARVNLERAIRINPGDERSYSALGIAYAGLGRANDAVREGERGVAMLPVEKEAWRGTFRLIDLAKIHAMVGNQEKAIDLLERLLSIPAELSPVYLRLDPTWKSLRGNKRFDELIKEK